LLINIGFHMPVIPFREVPDKTGTELPEQMVSDVPKLKVGVVLDPMVTVNVAGTAHCPADGVNV
jgi:hypothetical protein